MNRSHEPSGGTPQTTDGKSVDQRMREVRIVWFGLLMGQLMFCAVMAIIGGSLWKGAEPSALTAPLAAVQGVMILGTFAASVVFRASFLSRLRGQAAQLRQAQDPLIAAFEPFRTFSVVRMALVEAVGFFGLVNYLVTGATLALIVPAATILWFLLSFPSESAARRQVQNALETA